MACALSYTHTHVQSAIAMRYHDSTAQHLRQHAHVYNSSLCMASTGLHTTASVVLVVLREPWLASLCVCVPFTARRVCPLAVRSAR